ncbi:MAG TPA: OB-fold domain-containing protein [Acidimicrobiia bacterium]|nr:OB-fold domain-containing protein [Acidimicrobiia bacterium]
MDAGALSPPVPTPDAVSKFFWDGVTEHRLVIQRCDHCGTYMHLPRIVCRVCLSTELSPAEVSGRAVLRTWTIPQAPFDPYYQQHIGYVLAVVELVEQPHLTMVTNVVDCAEADLRIEMPLQVTFREVAPGVTLPLFAPAAPVAD